MNTIGPKLTMTVKRIDHIASLTPSTDLNKFGAMTFPLFIGGLWYYDASGNSWFAILGGIVGGMSAGLLWTVSGFM